jgi:tetratricopeptide (TPR) repeat protein
MNAPSYACIAGAVVALASLNIASPAALGDGVAESPPAAGRGEAASEVEQHVARAIAFSYLRNAEDLEKEYLYFKGIDGFLEERGQKTTGLSDNLLDLTLSSIEDRDAYLEAQHNLLGHSADADLRDRVTFRLTDEVASADSLILTDRYNRFAFIFNTFVRPLSLLALGYFPAMIDAGVATLLNAGKLTDLSVEEKKALVLYKQFLDRYPDSDKAEILRRRVTKLDRKRIEKSYETELLLAHERMADGEFWQAQQHFKNALAYRPDDPAATEGLKQARSLELDRSALRRKSLEPVTIRQETADNDEERAYRNILYATAIGSPENMIYGAECFLDRYPQSTYAPYAQYCIAVAHDMKGAHGAAREMMREIAKKYRGSHAARHAEAYLEDPDYNPWRAFQNARMERGKRTTKFVILGDEFVKSNVIVSTGRLITQGLQAVQTIGTFNVVALLIRGVNTMLKNPVSDQEVIDAGLSYLRRSPDGPESSDVHYLLAGAYTKRQNLSKALYHYAASGRVSEKGLAKLRENAAKQYLDFAEATDSREEKIRCYETILDEYPKTKAAVKALEGIAVLERTGKPLFELDKKTLGENPVVFKLTALTITPQLLDGDPDNGELADRGLYSTQRGKITIVYAGREGENERTVDIDYPTYKGLMAFAEEVAYRKRVSDRDGKQVAAKFPMELRGTVGNAGVYVYPRLKVREYQEKDLYLYK